MEGFFTDSELNTIENTIVLGDACNKCGLFQKCKSPKMKASGKGKIPVLFIAEAPGEEEDRLNTQLIGKTGRFFRDMLDNCFGIDLDECRKINAINCRPTDKDGYNRKPILNEIIYCSYFVKKEIESFQPNVIILLGDSALRSWLNNRWRGESESETGIVTKWRGWTIPDISNNCWVVPTFHPSYVSKLQNSDEGRVVLKIFIDDIEKALSKKDKKPNYPSLEDMKKRVRIITDSQETIKELHSLREKTRNPNTILSFDYETTGLKPFTKGHDIKICSFCTTPTESVVFRMGIEFEGYEKIRGLWKQILRSPSKKMAHNLQYEEVWSRVVLGTGVNNWYYDSMIGSHVEDNRSGITGLKFQSFVKLGIPDYDSGIKPYLGGNDKNKGFNQIEVAIKDKSVRNDLMCYCGLDSLFQFLLSRRQKEIQKEESYQLLHDGAITLAECQVNGIPVDVSKCLTMHNHLTRKIDRLEHSLQKSEWGKKWKELFGAKMNLNSFPQLADVLISFNCSLCKTEKGMYSVSESSLKEINHPLAKNILEIRKLKKIKNTYLTNFIREEENGVIHPMYSVTTTKTYRSSSERPNFQNIPSRDKEAQKICRSIFVPRKDEILVERDYSGIEVRIAACYHKDPSMLEEIANPSRDMHRDMAMEIYLLDGWCSDEARFAAKNAFVFAQFYGDYHVNCAKGLWKYIEQLSLVNEKGVSLYEHLKTKKIKNYGDFEKHIKKVEDRFWNVRFPVYNKWREKWYEEYLKRGYFKTFTGFYCKGFMKRNDAINYPVQGSAFHCLLKSLCIIRERIKTEKIKAMLCGQIHDSIIASVRAEPNDFNRYNKICEDVMTKEIKKDWPWIATPLSVSLECAVMNESWSEKRKAKKERCMVCGCEYAFATKTNTTITDWECVLCGERWTTEKNNV